jgi:rhodanese-related sulfurtransferase
MFSRFNFFKKLFVRKDKTSTNDLKSIISNGGFLVDLRTKDEFGQGHIEGSINIPLAELGKSLEKFKDHTHIVLVCFSGNRSGFAKDILEKKGFKNTINAGAWEEVNHLLTEQK